MRRVEAKAIFDSIADEGVTHLCGLYFAANSETELLDQMQVFAEEVVPRLT